MNGEGLDFNRDNLPSGTEASLINILGEDVRIVSYKENAGWVDFVIENRQRIDYDERSLIADLFDSNVSSVTFRHHREKYGYSEYTIEGITDYLYVYVR